MSVRKVIGMLKSVKFSAILVGVVRKHLLTVMVLLAANSLSGDSFLKEGERLLLEDNPKGALPALQNALNADPSNERIYLYLGLVHEQLQEYDKAISVMRRGLTIATSTTHLLHYNIGNNYFRLGEYIVADQMYTKAIGAHPDQPEPYLNRANARLKTKNYRGSLADYSMYLMLKPYSGQRDQIERVIAILSETLEQEEQKKRDQLERQRALMSEVLNSLRNASQDTRNLSSGSEDIEEAYDEVDIDD